MKGPKLDPRTSVIRAKIGRTLERRRVALKMEPVDLAARADVDLSQLSKMLHGKLSGSWASLERVAAALGWTLADLLAAAVPPRRHHRSASL